MKACPHAGRFQSQGFSSGSRGQPSNGVVLLYVFHQEVALIISIYLGASAGTNAGQAQSIATLCSNIKKDVVEQLGACPEILKTTEGFLKAVLRHYKVDVENAIQHSLLSARAKMYYRVGRLCQGWPKHQVIIMVVRICSYVPT